MFNPASDQYKCCCNTLHVKLGTFILAIVSVFDIVHTPFVFAERVSLMHLDNSTSTYYPEISLVCAAGLWVFEVVAVTCLFVGLAKEMAALLMPYALLMFILMGAKFALCILLLVFAVCSKFVQGSGVTLVNSLDMRATKEMDDSHVGAFFLTLALVSFMVGCVELWLMTVVLDCHKYFIDKAQDIHALTPEDGDVGKEKIKYERIKF